MFEYFFIPFSFLLILYSRDNNKFVQVFVIIWSIITALIGDRTSGIGGLLALMLLNIYINRASFSLKRVIKYAVVLGFVILLISFARTYREGIDSSNEGNTIIQVIGEIGGSFFPVTLIMQICPSPHDYLYGLSYLTSIIAGWVPESLDFTSTITELLRISIEPVYWIDSDYDYTFGTGYSLCAEAYANFGFCGFIAIFFIGKAIIKLLAYNKGNLFSLYVSVVMLFELFTLPRRNFYYIINHSFYCIIIMSIIIICFTRKD